MSCIELYSFAFWFQYDRTPVVTVPWRKKKKLIVRGWMVEIVPGNNFTLCFLVSVYIEM